MEIFPNFQGQAINEKLMVYHLWDIAQDIFYWLSLWQILQAPPWWGTLFVRWMFVSGDILELHDAGKQIEVF